jgi:hypothetical protein
MVGIITEVVHTYSAQSPPPYTSPTRTWTCSLARRDTSRSNSDRKNGQRTVARVLKTLGRVVKRVVITVFLDIPVCIVLVTAGAVVFVVSGTVKVAWWAVKTAAQAVGGVMACMDVVTYEDWR